MTRVEAVLYSERRTVRFQEVDAAGIVFFARTFEFFHDAYVGFLRERGVSLESALEDGGWVAPLRHAEADYVRPLRFGDVLDVSIVSVRMEETEYTVEYRIRVGGERACSGRTLHVSVDPKTFRRAPVPAVLRRALEDPPAGTESGGVLAGDRDTEGK